MAGAWCVAGTAYSGRTQGSHLPALGVRRAREGETRLLTRTADGDALEQALPAPLDHEIENLIHIP